jgi:hypothetical protein
MIKVTILSILTILLLVTGNLRASSMGCIIEDSTLYTITENDGSIVVARNKDSKNIELVIIRQLQEVTIIDCPAR